MTNLDPAPIAPGIPKPRVKGDFYPLQKVELIALRQAKLINNTAFVYLAVRYQHPYSDRPIRIRTKEFSIEWGIPESSLYEAIATLKREKVIKILTRELVIEWNSQQAHDSDNPESILGSHSPFRDPGKHSGSPEKSASKAKSRKGFKQQSPQTFKTSKSLKLAEGVENNEQGEVCANPDQKRISQSTAQINPEIATKPEASHPEREDDFTLPPLLQQAKSLGVNLNDTRLQTAISTFPERVPTALATLIEKPSGMVRSPTRFLESAIKENWQPETHINPEFNHWFTEAKRHDCPISGAEFRDGVQWVISTNGHHYAWEKLHSLSWEQIHQQLSSQPPLDLSNTLVAIDCEIDRLGWSLEKSRDFLHQTFGKPHRELLTDGELLDFLNCLKTQHTEQMEG